MTVADFLNLIGFPVQALTDFMRALAVKVPQVAADVEEWIAKLSAPLTLENLTAVFAVLPQEMLNIVQGKLEPKPHPGDGA